MITRLIVGDIHADIGCYGVMMACRVLGLTPAGKDAQGHIAIAPGGAGVQIQSRYDGRAQMGSFCNGKYDEVIFLHLNDKGKVTRALKFPAAVVDDYACNNIHRTSRNLIISQEVLLDPRVEDITCLFRSPM